jgi:hypothetical protein
MTRLISLALAAAVMAAPLAAPVVASAQEAEEPSLLEEGANLMLRGLLEEVAPPLEELAGVVNNDLLPIFRTLAEEMGPAIAEVAGQIDNITYYEPPVIAPNGDIVIRRRADAPAWIPPEDRPDAEPEVAPESGDAADPGAEIEL